MGAQRQSVAPELDHNKGGPTGPNLSPENQGAVPASTALPMRELRGTRRAALLRARPG